MKLYFKGQTDETEGVMLIAMVRQDQQDQAAAVQNEIGCPVL
jgi:hypothetical protein